MTYALKGIQAGLGPGEQVPLRREVDEWWFSKNENDLNQRSLFMYALREFQNMDPKEQLSYFGIAGTRQTPFTTLKALLTVARNPWPASCALGYKEEQG